MKLFNGIVTTLLLIICITKNAKSSGYSMYVWRNGWDSSVPGCKDRTEFEAWNPNSPCFTHTWNTAYKRSWLWSTCARSDRRVGTLYLYDTQTALATRDCSNPGVKLIQQALSEGRQNLPDLKFYALFSDGGETVPESRHVPNVVWYNTYCASYANKNRFDGVAVNNENWDVNWSNDRMVSYLNNLNKIVIEAAKQNPPTLDTHFSVGWNWGVRGDLDINLTWNGKTQRVMRHFIDIFSSIDVQVAFVTADAIQNRLKIAEWNYSVSVGKPLLATVYINKATPCQVTYFPFRQGDPDCGAVWAYPYKNETSMFNQLDAFQHSLIGSRVVLHHFRGAYSSGADATWPRH